MSALSILFTFYLFCSHASHGAPCFEQDVLYIDMVEPEVNVTCSQCEHTVDFLRNETDILEKIDDSIEFICGKIYGPTAHQCVNITEDIKKTLQYLNQTNSTTVCRNLHYC